MLHFLGKVIVGQATESAVDNVMNMVPLWARIVFGVAAIGLVIAKLMEKVGAL